MIKLKAIRTIICSFILISLSLQVYSQIWSVDKVETNIDSLKLLINQAKDPIEKGIHLATLSKSYLKTNPDSARFYMNQLKSLVTTHETSILIIHKTLLTELYMVENQLDKAQEEINEVVNLMEGLEDKTWTPLILQSIGETSEGFAFTVGNVDLLLFAERAYNKAIESNQSINTVDFNIQLTLRIASIRFYSLRYDEAIEILLESLKENENDPTLSNEAKAAVYSAISKNYARIDNDQNAIDFAKKAISLNSSRKISFDCNRLLGEVYEKQQKWDLAKNHYKNSLEIRPTHQTYDYAIHELLHRLGDISNIQKSYAEAEDYYNKSIVILNELPRVLGDKVGGAVYFGLSKAQFSVNRLNDARLNAEKALFLLESNNSNIKYIHLKWRESLRDTYLILSKIDSAENDHKSSIANYKAFFEVHKEIETSKDSIYNLEKLKTISELTVKHKSEQKDKEISILNLRDKQRNYIQAGLIVGTVLLLVSLISSRHTIKLRKKTYHTIKEKSDENELLMREIHHRVKNNLQIILSLMNAQIVNYQDDKKLCDILTESQTKIKSMAMIHQNLYHGNNFTTVPTATYLTDLINHIQESYTSTEEGNVQVETQIEDREIKMALAVPLGLILSELITNAYKYAFKAHDKHKAIKVNFYSQGDQKSYKLEVHDNGVGLPSDFSIDRLQSFGMQLVQGLIYQLNGSMKVNKSEGACFDIYLEEPENT